MDSLVVQSANEEDQEMFDGSPFEPYSIAHGPDTWDAEANINAEYPRLPPYPVDENGEAFPETVEADKDVDITMDQLPDELRQPLFTAEQLRNAPWAQRRFYPSHLEWLDQEAGYEAYSTLRDSADRLLAIARQEFATASSQAGVSDTSQSLTQVVAQLDSLQAESMALLRQNISLGGEVQQLRLGEVDIANPHFVRQRQVYIEKQQKALDQEMQRNKDLQALLRQQQEAQPDAARIQDLEARIRALEAENPQPEVNAVYDEVERMRADRDAALTAARVLRDNSESVAVADGTKEEHDRLRIEVEDLRVEQDRSYLDFQRLFHERDGLVQGREILTNELAQARAEIARLNGGGNSTTPSGIPLRDPGRSGPSAEYSIITKDNALVRKLNQATAERDAAVQSEQTIRAEFQAHMERSNIGARGIRDFNEYLRESLWARSTAGVIAQRVIRDERDQLRRRVTDLERELATQRDPKNLTACEEFAAQYDSLLQDKRSYRNRVNGLLRWNERMHDLIMNPNFRSELGMNLARDGILTDVVFEDALQAEEDRNLQEAFDLDDLDDEFLEINALFGGEDGVQAANVDAQAANVDGDRDEQTMEDVQNDSTLAEPSHQPIEGEISRPDVNSPAPESTANQNTTASEYIGGDQVRYPLTSFRRVNEDEAPEPPERFRPDITDPCERRCAYLLFILRQDRRLSDNQARELMRSERLRRIAEAERDARPLNCDQYQQQLQTLRQRMGQLVSVLHQSEDLRDQLGDMSDQAQRARIQAEERSAEDLARLRVQTLIAQQQQARADFAMDETVGSRQETAVALEERDEARWERDIALQKAKQANLNTDDRPNAPDAPGNDPAPHGNPGELDDCEERCAQKQARIEELEKELATAQLQSSRLEREAQMYRSSQDAQQQPSNQRETHAEAFPTTGNSQEPDDCEGRCRKKQEEIDRLEDILKRARATMNEDDATISTLKDEKKKLKEELDTCKIQTSRETSPSASSFYSASSQPTQSQEYMTEPPNEVNQFLDDDEEPSNPECKEKCDYLQRRLNACEARRAELQRQVDLLEATSYGLEVDNTSLSNRVNILETQTHQQRPGAQTHNTQEPDAYWKRHAEYLEQQRTDLNERLSRLEEENLTLNRQISDEDCQNRIAALQKTLGDTTKKLRKEIDAHAECQKNGRLQEQQIRFDSYYLRQLQGMIADRNDQFRQQLQDLQAQLQAAGHDVDDALMDSIQRITDRCNDLEDEVQQLQYTVRESEREEETRQQNLQQTNDSIENERRQYQQLLGESRQRYANYETRLRDTGVQLMQRTYELNITRALLKNLQDNPDDGSTPPCEKKCEQYEGALNDAYQRAADLESQIGQLRQELDQRRQNGQVIDDLQAQLDAEKQKATEHETEFDNYRDRMALYITENEELRNGNDGLKEQIKKIQEALNNCIQHGNSLRQEGNELRNQYQRLLNRTSNRVENTTRAQAPPPEEPEAEEDKNDEESQAEIQQDLEALTQEITLLLDENANLQAQLTQREESNSQQRHLAATAAAANNDDEAADRIRTLTGQNAVLTTQLRDSIDTLQRANEVNAILSRRRQELSRQLDEEREAREALQRALNQCNDRHVRRDAAELGIGDKIDKILDGGSQDGSGDESEDGKNDKEHQKEERENHQGEKKSKEKNDSQDKKDTQEKKGSKREKDIPTKKKDPKSPHGQATLPRRRSESTVSGCSTPDSNDSSSASEYTPQKDKAVKSAKTAKNRKGESGGNVGQKRKAVDVVGKKGGRARKKARA